MWHFLSTFTSEITNKNCHLTFLLRPPPHSGLKIRKMCKNSSFHWNSTNSTLFKSWWQQLYLSKIPNSGFSRFLRKSLVKIFHGNFPIQLEKVPNFFTKLSVTFFLNISVKSFLHSWKTWTFLFLGNIKCHPPFSFSTLGRNSSWKMYQLSKTTPF